MAFFNTHTEDYYKKLIELQEKLRKSEEERLKLEMKFNEMTQITREEEQMHFRKLRSQYKRFLEEDRRRQDRNERIARTLDRIESRVSMLMAKTERFKLLRQQYHSFLNRIYNNNQRIPEKTGDEVENYIKNLSSDKLNELLHKEEEARRRLPFTKPSYSEETPKKTGFFRMADEEIRPNYANSIADDIMNEIFSKKNKELKLNKQPAEFEKRNLYDDNPSLFVSKTCETTIGTPSPYFREKFIENKEVKYAQGMPVDQTFRNENPIENLVQQQFEKLPNNSHNEKLSNVCLSPENQSRLNESKSCENVLEQNEIIGMENVNKVLNENINRHHDGDNIIVDQNNTGLEREISVGNEVGLIKQQDINKNNQLEGENVLVMENITKINENENVLLEENSGAQYPERINQVKLKENEKIVQDNSQAPEQKNKSDLNQEQTDINAQYMADNKPYNQREEVAENYEIGQPDQHKLQTKQVHQEEYNKNDQIVQEHTEEYDNSNNGEQSISQTQHQYDENGQLIQQYDENGAQLVQPYDDQNQPMQQYDEERQPIHLQYDENGQLLQQYTEQGEPIQQYEEQSQPIQQYDDQDQPIQLYDDHGQLMQQYDDQGQPMQQYDNQGHPMQQYDDQGQPMQQYDDQSQPIQQYDDQGQPMQQYDDQGQPMQQYDDQGLPMQQYDDQRRPMQQYDDQGQPMQQYDDQGQLLQQYDENDQPIQHQYDENGQLIGQYDINSQYDESGQLIQQYDEQGQLINQYNDHPVEQQQQFDENGQPIEYAGHHEAQYDENGQLIQYLNNEQYYNNPEQYAEQADEAENPNNVVVEETPVLSETKTSESVQPLPEKPKNVMEMLDTDTESAKQDTTKISNDSDFDFSNN